MTSASEGFGRVWGLHTPEDLSYPLSVCAFPSPSSSPRESPVSFTSKGRFGGLGHPWSPGAVWLQQGCLCTLPPFTDCVPHVWPYHGHAEGLYPLSKLSWKIQFFPLHHPIWILIINVGWYLELCPWGLSINLGSSLGFVRGTVIVWTLTG